MKLSNKLFKEMVDEYRKQKYKKYFCDECKEKHPEKNVCPQCGKCLYKNAKQIPDDMFPIFECTNCGKRVFWD